jgi:hypothetical protein
MNSEYIRKLAIKQWEKEGRQGAFLRTYVDPNGKIYFDTMTNRFELVGWVNAKVKGVWKLLTAAEKEKADFAKLFAAMGNA